MTIRRTELYKSPSSVVVLSPVARRCLFEVQPHETCRVLWHRLVRLKRPQVAVRPAATLVVICT